MESESLLVKHRRYDISMSKRTRRSVVVATHITKVNGGEEKKWKCEENEVDEELERTSEIVEVVITETNVGEEKEMKCEAVSSKENEGGGELKDTPQRIEVVVTETVLPPVTSRPSLKELMIQVTNTEEKDDGQATEEKEGSENEKVPERENEEKMISTSEKHQQIVVGSKQLQPGMARRCAKALNQIIKVRRATKQKSTVPVIAM